MRSSSIRPVVAFGAAVLCAVMATGCDSNGGDTPPGPGVHQVDLNKPLVTQDVLVPGTEEDHVTVGVLSLEDRDGLMVLSLVFTPDFRSVAEGDQISLSDMLGKSDFSPWLLDSANLKLYSALSAENLKSSGTGPRTVNGQSMYVWATFAPPEGDGPFDVYIQTAWPAFADVPVAQ